MSTVQEMNEYFSAGAKLCFDLVFPFGSFNCQQCRVSNGQLPRPRDARPPSDAFRVASTAAP